MTTDRITAIRARLTDKRRRHCIGYLDRTRHDKHASVKILRQQCKTYLASLRPLSAKQTALVEHMTQADCWGKWWLP